jgi:SET domain-containing protein
VRSIFACLLLVGCVERAAAPAPFPKVPEPATPAKPQGLRTEAHPDWVEIRPSQIPGAGEGLFALVDIPKDTYIGPYSGRYIAPGKSDVLAGTREGLYLFTLPKCAQDDTRDTIAGDVDDYISKVNYAPEKINGHPTDLQNTYFATACKEPFVRLYAKRKIEAGEELYVDYGPNYDYHFMNLPDVQAYFMKAAGVEGPTFEFEYAKAEDD